MTELSPIGMGGMVMDEGIDHAEHIKTLREIAEGREAAAYAEQLVMDGLEPDVAKFRADDRSPITMRRQMIYNEARSNKRWAEKEAAAARWALAQLQTDASP